MIDRITTNRATPVSRAPEAQPEAAQPASVDSYDSSSSVLPRSSFDSEHPSMGWGTRLAIVAGLGLPAVGAAMIGATVSSPVEAADMSADLASELLFGTADAEAPKEVAANRELDANEKELQEKLTKFVEDHFDGDYDAAFEHFDQDGDERINRSELSEALKDIGVGNFLTRGAWVEGIMEKLDQSPQDGKLSHEELIDGVTNPRETA